MKNLFTGLIIVVISFSCKFSPEKKKEISIKSDTVIILSSEIKIIGQHSRDLGGSSFNPIVITKNDVEVFHDTSNEYWLSGLESKEYPKLLSCSDGSVQILIEIDDRPNINELKQIIITKYSKVVLNLLPVFLWNPKDINNDGKLELTGFLTDSESIANGDSIVYNPKLVYEFSNNCIAFDSLATIKLNKELYGDFYGFSYNESIILPNKRK